MGGTTVIIYERPDAHVGPSNGFCSRRIKLDLRKRTMQKETVQIKLLLNVINFADCDNANDLICFWSP